MAHIALVSVEEAMPVPLGALFRRGSAWKDVVDAENPAVERLFEIALAAKAFPALQWGGWEGVKRRFWQEKFAGDRRSAGRVYCRLEGVATAT